MASVDGPGHRSPGTKPGCAYGVFLLAICAAVTAGILGGWLVVLNWLGRAEFLLLVAGMAGVVLAWLAVAYTLVGMLERR